MQDDTLQTPFEMLLMITGQLRIQDLEPFQAWVPFMKEAQWVCGRLPSTDHSAIEPEAMEAVVIGLLSNLADKGITNSGQFLAFLLADWEEMEIGIIERFFNLFEDNFPGAGISAITLSSSEGHPLDLILVAR